MIRRYDTYIRYINHSSSFPLHQQSNIRLIFLRSSFRDVSGPATCPHHPNSCTPLKLTKISSRYLTSTQNNNVNMPSLYGFHQAVKSATRSPLSLHQSTNAGVNKPPTDTSLIGWAIKRIGRSFGSHNSKGSRPAGAEDESLAIYPARLSAWQSSSSRT